jgi:hypothetical protein
MRIVHIFSHIEDGVPMLFAQLSCACVYPITSAMVFDCEETACPLHEESRYTGVAPVPPEPGPCEGV